MDKKIQEIVEKALNYEKINREELAVLFSAEDHSEEARLIQYAGRKISSELTNNKAEIHGQIGIDISPCPRDCKYCSFAASNKVFDKSMELELEDIIAGILSMESQGANAIYIMTTARYKFEKLLDVAREVKKVMKTDIPLIVNTDDFDLVKAKELKDAGFDGIYHAIRMGEGEFTNISIDTRINSINAAKEAGLKLGMCVEPVGPEHTIEELVEKTMLTRELEARFSGAMRRTCLPSSILSKHGELSFMRMATIVGAVALATGKDILRNRTHEPNQLAINSGVNLLWAEVGSNPRDTESETVRGWTVNRCKDIYRECGWEVLEGPSEFFK